LIYSTALPVPVAAAAHEALAISQREPWRREHAQALGDRLRSTLAQGGIDIGRSSGPIIPVILGDPERTLAATRRLRERGFLVPAIRPPSVPEGTSRLRISVTAAHSEDQVDGLAHELSGI
jgi:8-amino-7-oxononanoate synthase